MKIIEAFDNKKREVGELKFSETLMTDKHIVDIIKHLSKDTGKSIKDIEKIIEAEVAKYDDIHAKSPILYQTMVKNAVESSVWKIFEEADHSKVKERVEFSKIVFNQLWNMIRVEHKQFFPLRNFIDKKFLLNPRKIFIPSNFEEDNKRFKSVTTAAATPKGEFIFNLKFMQDLLDFATFKKLKPKGKKYVSNGGDIPDQYAYIEFLILHELMHYSYADFYYAKKLKANNQIINWVGDFRSNYLLVKSGYEQIPIGLFNDGINYDRQSTYKEMYEIVKAEFDKLDKDQQDQVSKHMDDHEPGESSEGESESSDGDGDGDGDGEPDDSDGTWEDIDEKHKEVEKKMGEASDADKKDIDNSGDKAKGGGEGKGSKPGSAKGPGGTFNYDSIKPSFNWQSILKRCVTKQSLRTQNTFKKPAKSSSTRIHIAAQLGSTAIKPGEETIDEDIKLCVVVDSSGSMSHIIPRVYSELNKLLAGTGSVKFNNLFLIKFSDTFEIYSINIKNKTTNRMKSVSDKVNKADTKKDLRNVFTSTMNGGTVFSSALATEIKKLLNEEFNVIICTDADITYGPNFTEFSALTGAHKNALFSIFDEKKTFISVCERFKTVNKNFTYFTG